MARVILLKTNVWHIVRIHNMSSSSRKSSSSSSSSSSSHRHHHPADSGPVTSAGSSASAAAASAVPAASPATATHVRHIDLSPASAGAGAASAGSGRSSRHNHIDDELADIERLIGQHSGGGGKSSSRRSGNHATERKHASDSENSGESDEEDDVNEEGFDLEGVDEEEEEEYDLGNNEMFLALQPFLEDEEGKPLIEYVKDNFLVSETHHRDLVSRIDVHNENVRELNANIARLTEVMEKFYRAFKARPTSS